MARVRSLPRQRDEAHPQQLPLTLWIHRGMEGLWLLAAALIPLFYLDQDYLLSEAIIGYVEVPKVALLRTLAALIAVLWAVEWALRGGSSSVVDFIRASAGAPIRVPLRKLRAWLKDYPTRWVTLAVWFFLITTLITTALSASFWVSLLGEVPGQDGYPTYTVLAYILIFGAVATHLKTKAQLWRLLSALVIMGALISAYSIFQHYGHDFLSLNEDTGGSPSRSTATNGNALFAAAVMMMVIPITLGVAAIAFRVPKIVLNNSRRNTISSLATLGLAAGLSLVLATQILGMTFTLSRVAGVAAIVAMIGFTALAAISAGWRTSIQIVALIGLTGGGSAAILQWLGSVSILGLGPWVGALLVIWGLLGIATTYVNWNALIRMVMVAALPVVMAAAVFFVLLGFSGDTSPNKKSASSDGGTAGQVAEKLSSIPGQVLSGDLGGRGIHWSASWKLIKHRPWFEFDDLSLPWLRSVIGYGPDLFRYTQLLESTPDGPSLEPLEPDHAHNYFIHQTVEQGLLGLFSSLGIFAAVFIVGGYQIVKHRRIYSTAHKVMLIALVSTIFGRFFEMQFGVARVSDLTVLWILLAIFVALPNIMKEPDPTLASTPNPSPPSPHRTRRGRSPTVGRVIEWSQLWRLAVVACLIGGLGVLTWQKGINPPRAAAQVRVAANQFNHGDFQAALGSLDKAIDLAPNVSVYRTHRASVYRAFLANENRIAPESGCSSQSESGYDVCLANAALGSYQEAVDKNPFYYRSRTALAGFAYSMLQYDLAVRSFEETLDMVPASYLLRNELANAYIVTGRPQEAIGLLEESLAITGDSLLSSNALFLNGLAHFSSGYIEKAVPLLEDSLSLSLGEARSDRAYQILDDYYADKDNRLALAYLDRVISGNPGSVSAYIRRAGIHYELGDLEAARSDYSSALPWDPGNAGIYISRGQVNAELGLLNDAVWDYAKAVDLGADPAEAYLARGRAMAMVAEYQSALEEIGQALRLNPKLIPAYISQAQVYAALEQFEDALQAYKQALVLEPDNASVYANRGTLYFNQQEYSLAIHDFDRALELAQDTCAAPDCADVLYLRGLTSYKLGLYQRSIVDLNLAVQLNPTLPEAYLLRGDAHQALGREDLAQRDRDRAAQISTE